MLSKIIEFFSPCFHFPQYSINYSKLCELYIYFIPKISKKVNELGKISARTIDKTGYFIKWSNNILPVDWNNNLSQS